MFMGLPSQPIYILFPSLYLTLLTNIFQYAIEIRMLGEDIFALYLRLLGKIQVSHQVRC